MDRFRRRQFWKRVSPLLVAAALLGLVPLGARAVMQPQSVAVTTVGGPTTFASSSARLAHTGSPSGTRPGDVVLAILSTRSRARVACASGWRKGLDVTNGGEMRLVACSIVVGNSSVAPAMTITPADHVAMVTTAYRGIDRTNPIAETTSSLGMRSPSVTITQRGQIAILAHASSYWQFDYHAPTGAALVGGIDDHSGAEVAAASERVNALGGFAPPGWRAALRSRSLVVRTGRPREWRTSSLSTTLVLRSQVIGVPPTTVGPTSTTTGDTTTTTTVGSTTTTHPATTTTSAATTTTSSTLPTTTTTVDVGGGSVNRAHPFSASGPWNSPTPSGTRWFDTTPLHQLHDGTFRHWWVNYNALSVVWSSPTDPVWTFDLPDYDAPAWGRHRHATRFTMRAPADLAAGTDDDHLLEVVDPQTGDYVEVWEASVDSTHRVVTNRAGQPGWATGNASTGPGAGSTANNDGVRASNFSWLGGLITGADLSAGTIDHALAIALPPDMLLGGSAPVGPFRAPATGGNGAWPSGPIEMGSKIGIPAATAMPPGLSRLGVMVFRALQRYGSYVGDCAGGAWPMFYSDAGSIAPTSAIDYGPFDPLVAFWDHGGSSDMEKLGPLLRVADYQP